MPETCSDCGRERSICCDGPMGGKYCMICCPNRNDPDHRTMDTQENADIVKRWKKEVCDKADEIDPDQELTWRGLWYGFVIGAGRPDLATYKAYMRFGFPEEGK